jgi:L-2,4-diaminobutyrate transaminase
VLSDESTQKPVFAHGHTTTAHPVGAAAALANLDILEHEQLVENAGRVGKRLQQRLREAFSDHPLVGEVRGVGLMAGVELVADRERRVPFELALKIGPRMQERLLEEGLISRPIGNSMAFSPPLIVTDAEVEEIVERFDRGLDRLTKDLRSDGIWNG